MDTPDVAPAVEAWAVAAVPALNSYDEAPQELSQALPLVIAELALEAVGNAAAARFSESIGGYQQTFLRVWTVDLTIMSTPSPEWTASRPLYAYVDALGKALRAGVKLGDDMVMSQFYTANFVPAEIEYEDGTRVRQVTMTLTLGSMIGA